MSAQLTQSAGTLLYSIRPMIVSNNHCFFAWNSRHVYEDSPPIAVLLFATLQLLLQGLMRRVLVVDHVFVANEVCEGCISRKLQAAIDLGGARYFRAWRTEDGVLFCIGWYS